MESMRSSSAYTKIAPDDPFLALRDPATLMKEAISTMLVEQSHTHFQPNDDWLGSPTLLARGLLSFAQLWVKDRLSPDATCRWPCEIYE